ncbi:MAG TPA: phytanoyl-CoA dioxygenase family protein [Xanthobacteraceae bacterium]|nr:phytanoyl-CoA dioxygenase family protein [Xanthobacteraceae bacterium]
MATATCDLVEAFYRSGYLQLDGIVRASDVRRILNEFHDILDRDHPCFGRDKYGSSNIVTARPAEMAAAGLHYPALAAFLQDPRLKSIILGYLSRFFTNPRDLDHYDINEQIEVEHNDCVGDGNSGIWHFDRVPSVKCALFLVPTRREFGALEVIPESHFAARQHALHFLERNPDPLFIDNHVEFQSQPEIKSLEVEAGTVVLFDTFVIHRGGNVTAHGERKVIRAVTWPPALTRNYLGATMASQSQPEDAAYRLFFPFDRSGQGISDPRHRFAG